MATSIPEPKAADLPPAGIPNRTMGLSVLSAISGEELRPDIGAVERYFGGSAYSADSRTRERIRDAIKSACGTVSPRIVHTINSACLSPDGTIHISDRWQIPLPAAGCHPKIRSVAAVIATLGDALENECRILAQDRHLFQSTLLDAVGTAMLDTLDRRIRSMIEDKCREYGLFGGLRFSPGLNGYPLEIQETIFQMTDALSANIRLNDSFVMAPVKTISFFMALSDEKPAPQGDKCTGCRLTSCQFRKGRPPAPEPPAKTATA